MPRWIPFFFGSCRVSKKQEPLPRVSVFVLGLPRAVLLRALQLAATQYQREGKDPDPYSQPERDITLQEAETIVGMFSGIIPMLGSRWMMVDLKPDENGCVDAADYDRVNGEGTFKRVVDELRRDSAFKGVPDTL